MPTSNILTAEFPTVSPVESCSEMYRQFSIKPTRNFCNKQTQKINVYKQYGAPIKVTLPATWPLNVVFRKKYPNVDAFLAHCEVGGHILRRWAIHNGHGQHLVFPIRPGSLNKGIEIELTVQEIHQYARQLAGHEPAAWQSDC
jgi:hypothetical protein